MKLTEIAGKLPVMKMHGCGNDFVVLADPDDVLDRGGCDHESRWEPYHGHV